MSRSFRILAALFAVSAGSAALTGQNAVMLWQNANWSNYTTVPSYVWTNPTTNVESADDFDVQGTVTRVLIDASGCFNCAPAPINGVWVRFYQWNAGNPGSLQYQAYVPSTSPALIYGNPSTPDIDVTLPTPFAATGKHFVSVQLDFVTAGYWGAWLANYNAPSLSPVKYRDNLGTGTWGNYVLQFLGQSINADLSMQIWGTPATPVTQPVDPCGVWETMAMPIPPTSTRCLMRAVKANAVDDIWAVGELDTPSTFGTQTTNVTMHWDGFDWSIVPISTPTASATSTPNAGLWAVDGTSATDVWAAGQAYIGVNGGWVGPQVQIQHWDGNSWTLMPNTPLPATSIGAGVTGNWVYDIDALTPNDAWFVGRWIDILPSSLTTRPGLLTHWNGSSFTQTNLPIVTGVGGQVFSAVKAISANDVWVVGTGEGYIGSNSTVPVVFHYNGSSWTHLPPPVPTGFISYYDVDATAANDVWLMGVAFNGTGQSTPFVNRWNGSTWTLLPGTPSTVAMKALSGGILYQGGFGISRFDGVSWSQTTTFATVPGAGVNSLDLTGNCELVAVGGSTLAGSIVPFSARLRTPTLYRTTPRPACATPNGTAALLEPITTPRIGRTFSVSVSDPSGALPVAAGLTYWVMSTVSLANASGCGVPIVYGGVGGPGELFVDPNSIVYASGPTVSFASAPVTHSVFIPQIPALAGFEVFTQAAIVDYVNPTFMILSNGLDVRIGN